MIDQMGLMPGSPFYQPKHRIRGTLVHDACAMEGAGATIPDTWWKDSSGSLAHLTYVAHEECRPFFEAYVSWKLASGWRMEVAEREVRYGNLWIGHIDQIGSFARRWDHDSDLDTWIVDLKNGDEEPWHRLQLALYHLGLQVERPKARIHRANLYLAANGSYRFIDRTHYVQDLRNALAMAQWFHARQEYIAA